MTRKAADMDALLRASRVLAVDGWLDEAAVGVANGRVAWLGPAADAPSARQVVDLGDSLLAPGFVDLQVNGGGGALFNQDRSVEALRRIAAAHRRFGTTALLPTLISDTPLAMREAIKAARRAVVEGVPGIIGLHLEGPYLARERRGVHRAEHFHSPDSEDIESLLAHALPHLLLTLAPEAVSLSAITRLADAGIRLSMGHTAASFEQAEAAISAGVRGATHLFNAMPPWAGRAPGALGASLLSPETWCGLIVDGQHLHSASVKLAMRMKPGRCFLVTDAMPPVGSALEAFDLDGRRILRRGDRLETEDGTLAGALLDMASAVRRCVQQTGAPLEDVLRMASTCPADFLGAQDLGRIEVGARADLVELCPDIEVRSTWIGGQREFAF